MSRRLAWAFALALIGQVVVGAVLVVGLFWRS